MRFTSFYAQPICGPSRTALMTGCYPLRVGEENNTKNHHPIVHSKEVTIAEVLKERGYATACFGKWDMAAHSQRGFRPELMPNKQGFDYFFGTPTSNDSFVDLYRNAELIEEKADMSTLTQRFTEEAIGFIRRNRAPSTGSGEPKPFFVYIPHTMVHVKLAASEKFRGKSKRGLYGDCVEEIDHETGRLLDVLRELKLVENTYVIFTSDNGPWLSYNKEFRDGIGPEDHGGSAGPLRSGKVTTWEGGVRVPTVAWAPGRVPAGTTCDKIATTMDLMPTLAALAGTQPPGDRIIDGKDIRHLLRGGFDKTDPDKVYYYYFGQHLQAVRQGKWKLHLPRPELPGWIHGGKHNRHIAREDDIGFENPMLIDLHSDLGETSDVADKNPEVVSKLLKLAETAREDIGDYDRIGSGARFFEPGPRRPGMNMWKEPRAKGKNKAKALPGKQGQRGPKP